MKRSAALGSVVALSAAAVLLIGCVPPSPTPVTTSTTSSTTSTWTPTTTTTLISQPGLLAVAYSNVDGVAGFAPDAGDVLIARLDDTNTDGQPSVGDTVTLGHYPINFSTTTYGTFRDQHLVVTRVDTSDLDNDGRVTDIQAWVSADGWVDIFDRTSTEGAGGYNSNGIWHAYDSFEGSEESDAQAWTPGDPDTATQRHLRQSTTNDSYADADIAFLPSH